MRDLLTDLIIEGGIDRKYREIPKYPSVIRDISFTTPYSVKAMDVIKNLNLCKGGNFISFTVFDYYPMEDTRSYTCTLEFNNPSRTLTDEEINSEVNKIITFLNSALGANLRS